MKILTTLFFAQFIISSQAKVMYPFGAFSIIANADSVFLSLYMAVFASLLSAFRENSIYKVLNLGVLSICVASLWAYHSELSFIFVVYILAFVGAVIMLFLSVILMLPLSAIAVPAVRAPQICLQASTSIISGGSLQLEIGDIATVVTIILLILILVHYLMLYRDDYIRNKNPAHMSSSCLKLEISQDEKAQAASKRLPIAALINTHTFYVVKKREEHWTACSKPFIIQESGLRIVNYMPNNNPVILMAVPHVMLASRSIFIKIAYEFINYYVRVIERKFTNVSILNKFAFIRNFIGEARFGSDGDLRNYLITNSSRQILETYEWDSKRRITIIPYTPWWSPFNIFSRPLGHKGGKPAPRWRTFISKCVDQFKITMSQKWMSKENSTKYKYNFWHGFDGGFILDELAYYIGHTGRKTSYKAAGVAEPTGQFTMSIAIFTLAVPAVAANSKTNDSALFVLGQAENLGAIQDILYSENPLLMFVSVTGLLVALIGAATMAGHQRYAEK